MIPYFQWQQFMIGPVPIQVWGLMVALGIIAGLALSRWKAQQSNLNTDYILDSAFWIIVSALVGGRVVYVLSEWYQFADNLGNVFKIWEGGMSITGGFIGAALAGWGYMRVKKIDFFEYADALIFGLPLGLFIGRLGCFFIIDHPGKPTDFFLGQVYTDGLVRHNAGLYLSLNGLLLLGLFFAMYKWKKEYQKGQYIMAFLVEYGLMRFFLDFVRATDLRVVDARFFGLTVAQYSAIAMVVLAGVTWYYIQKPSKSNS